MREFTVVPLGNMKNTDFVDWFVDRAWGRQRRIKLIKIRYYGCYIEPTAQVCGSYGCRL